MSGEHCCWMYKPKLFFKRALEGTIFLYIFEIKQNCFEVKSSMSTPITSLPPLLPLSLSLCAVIYSPLLIINNNNNKNVTYKALTTEVSKR